MAKADPNQIIREMFGTRSELKAEELQNIAIERFINGPDMPSGMASNITILSIDILAQKDHQAKPGEEGPTMWGLWPRWKYNDRPAGEFLLGGPFIKISDLKNSI